MINEKDWEHNLKNLTKEELDQLQNVIDRLKSAVETRKEFIDVLREWKEKYPNVKYFYSGGIWKGAYECSGEVGAFDYDDMFCDVEEIFDLKGCDASQHGDIYILDQFDDIEEFKKALLNTYILDCDDRSIREAFNKEMMDAKNSPNHTEAEAQDLYTGTNVCEFIDIDTGEKKYITSYW